MAQRLQQPQKKGGAIARALEILRSFAPLDGRGRPSLRELDRAEQRHHISPSSSP
jgi:hypothetical protein